jgi:copper(I)-binding protein
MKFFTVIAAGLLLAACSGPVTETPLLLQDAWVRAMPPGSMMTAGFGRLVNISGGELEVTGYTSPHFDDVSLHQSVLEDGVSRMNEVPALKIPTGANIELAPGGYHLMFMKPDQAYTDVVELHIEISDGRRFSFELPVERR